jgi:hypothetical protein
MKHLKKLALAATVACAFASSNAMAWGYNGHRIVGAIADQLLKGSKAEAQIRALLLPGESLESIAVWADNAKGSYNGSVVTPEMTEYTTANPKHQEYHYTDVPFQLDAYHEGGVGTADVDIVQTMKQAIAVLQGKTDPASNPHNFTRRQALLVLTHVAGDITQPLHVGAPYLDRNGAFAVPDTHAHLDGVQYVDLRGGNDLVLEDSTGPEKKTRALHSYWDSTLVDYAMKRISTRTPTEFAIAAIKDKPPVAPTAGDIATWPVQWANDTLQVSKRAYQGLVPGAMVMAPARNGGEARKNWVVAAPADYAVPASAIASEQLIKGGYRLAQVLQAVFN